MQLLTTTLFATSAVAAATKGWLPKFENLISFGDSYTDEGRAAYFNVNKGAPPPGTLMPFKNMTAGGGVTWPRYVSNFSGAKLFNYAVSGAACSDKLVSRWSPGAGRLAPDVVYEVDQFVTDVKWRNETTKTNTLFGNKRRGDNTAYALWVGTNDLGARGFLTDMNVKGKVIPDVVDCIYEKFDRIYDEGGRYFVLFNTPPLELSPLYGLPENGALAVSRYWPDKPANTTEWSQKMKQYTQLVNSIIDYRTPFEMKVSKRYRGAHFANFDVNAFMREIYYNPTKYFPAPANVTGVYHSCDVSGSPCTDSPLGLDHFLWYDELHPSAKADEIIAKEFIKVVAGKSKWATYW